MRTVRHVDLFAVLYLSRLVWSLGPWAHHITEPDHRTSLIYVSLAPNDTSLLADGYVFITPYVSDYHVGSFGPQIFTSDGTLIWNGNYTAKVRAMDAHVCDYLGELGTHICYNDAKPVEQAGHSAGAIRFFDNTYSQIGPDYGAEGLLRAPDIHELNTPRVTRGETFIQDVYELRSMDLTPYKGPEEGWVLDGCFQEIEIRTKTIVFEWCALDWMPVWDTYMFLHGVKSENFSMPVNGNGKRGAPWDFFHINSISKNEEGDYAISARHLDSIMKIAGKDNLHGVKPGTILWRLGGKHNDFQKDFNFSRQHTARFQSTGPTETVLSFFDNAFDGWMGTSKNSSGKLVKVNNETMTSNLITQYDVPGGGLSFSQGSMQVLENGNVFMGWGNRHIFSEFTNDGQLLYHANFSGHVESFRAWKFPWKGYPKHSPKVVAYAQNCTNSSLYAYVSWNGATEVSAWKFYSSWSTHLGPWYHTGTFSKVGFETFANFSTTASKPELALYAPYVYADALDSQGSILASSNVVHTFIPKNQSIYEDYNCTENLCEADWFRFEEHLSCGATCPRSHIEGAWTLVFLICTIEVVAWFLGELGWRALRIEHAYDRLGGSDHTEWEKEALPFIENGNISLAEDSNVFMPHTLATKNGRRQDREVSRLTTGLNNLLMLIGLGGTFNDERRTSEDDALLIVQRTRRRTGDSLNVNQERPMQGKLGSAVRVSASGVGI